MLFSISSTVILITNMFLFAMEYIYSDSSCQCSMTPVLGSPVTNHKRDSLLVMQA